MIDRSIVRRLYQAADAVARSVYHGDYTDELLARLGIPGLISRLELKPTSPHEASFLPALKLHQTLLREGAEQLSERLGRAGIAHCFVKGVALLGSVYRPGDRFLWDVDLYVPPGQRVRTLEVLQQLGYVELPERDQSGPAALRTALALQRDAASEMERLTVDLHWSLDPVERFLPRRDRPVPEQVWSQLDTAGPIPIPSPEHHAAILVHHLVHTDLLHVRSLLDLALLVNQWPSADAVDYLATCRQLRIGRFGNLLLQLLRDELGVAGPPPLADRPPAWNRFTRELTLNRWLSLVARSHPEHDSVITIGRIRRRLQLVDGRSAKFLFGDLLFPPKAFLEWRWQDDRPGRALLKHYGQLARKALRS